MDIRQHDLNEIALLYGKDADPQELLGHSLAASDLTYEYRDNDNNLVAIGGVVYNPIEPSSACVWLIGSTLLDSLYHQKTVLKKGRQLIKNLLGRFTKLYNYCSAEPSQLRSMRALGFTIIDTDDPNIKKIEICA